jgi:hypothetical protein
MGTELGEMYYTNISSHVCSLFGYPLIQLKDESGFVYQAQVTNTPYMYGNKTPTNVLLQENNTAHSSFALLGEDAYLSQRGQHSYLLLYPTMPRKYLLKLLTI